MIVLVVVEVLELVVVLVVLFVIVLEVVVVVVFVIVVDENGSRQHFDLKLPMIPSQRFWVTVSQ